MNYPGFFRLTELQKPEPEPEPKPEVVPAVEPPLVVDRYGPSSFVMDVGDSVTRYTVNLWIGGPGHEAGGTMDGAWGKNVAFSFEIPHFMKERYETVVARILIGFKEKLTLLYGETSAMVIMIALGTVAKGISYSKSFTAEEIMYDPKD